jgi:hypothetical protein
VVGLDPSLAHPSVPFDPSYPDVEQAISMEMGNLALLSHKTSAAEAVGLEADPMQGSRAFRNVV